MGKQIEQMDQQPQQPQLLFLTDNANQTGPPYYVDLFIEAGLTAIIPFSDGNHHQIKGPGTCLLVSNKSDPPRPIMLYFENLKQVVDRNGTLRQLIIVNKNNPHQTTLTTATKTYSNKRKSSKQIDSNNNNTNGHKNGLPTAIYGKCSPNSTPLDSQELLSSTASSPEHQYTSYYNCSLCYPDSYAPDSYSLMNGCHLSNPMNSNPINHQLNTVPTATNATNSIYTSPLPLIDPTTIPQATTPQSNNHSQLSQPTCSTSPFNHTPPNPHPVTVVNRPFNLDNILNNQNNKLLLKAAKNKLNLPVNYGQTNHQFLLNSTSNLVNTGNEKLSPKPFHNINSSNSHKRANSPVNGHSTSGHQMIKNLHLNKKTTNLTNSTSSSSSNGVRNGTQTGTSVQQSTKLTNKAKSIYSDHYQDSYHSHLHANHPQSTTTLNYELNERVRKDKYNLTNSLNSTVRNGAKRKETFKGFKMIDKQPIKSSSSGTNGEMMTSNSFKRFDEIKSNKSVDSPVTSSSPISEHYDFSSEESESAQYSSTKQPKRTNGDDISLKNKTLNSNNYLQPSSHLTYRQTNKDSYKDASYYSKRQTTNANQKNGKESLQDVKRTGHSSGQTNTQSNKSTNATTMAKKKLIQEDDRDDGFGDELDYRVYNVQQQQSNKLSTATVTNTANSSMQKQLTANLTKSKSHLDQKTSVSMPIELPVKIIQTGLSSTANKKSIQSDHANRSRKDELVTNESNDECLKSNNLTSVEQPTNEISANDQLDVQQVSTHNKMEKSKISRTLQSDVDREMKSSQSNEDLKNVEVKKETIDENSSQQVESSAPVDQQVINRQVDKCVEEKVVTRSVNLKQNEMPVVIAFNLIETQVTSNLVRLKWTKNSGISMTNLDRPNYQIEMMYLKREDNQSSKCSRIVQQCSQKSCKIHNLNSEQEYTFRVRLVYEEQLYLSNDLVITTLPNEKMTNNSNKKNKSKNQQSITVNKEQPEIRVEHARKSSMPNPLITYLNELSIVLNDVKAKFSFIGKEKFYALFYLCLFGTICFLFAIIFHNSYIH